jgi:hypothetical protein
MGCAGLHACKQPETHALHSDVAVIAQHGSLARILRRNWQPVRSAAAFLVYIEGGVCHVPAQSVGHARHEARSERCSLHTSYLMQ